MRTPFADREAEAPAPQQPLLQRLPLGWLLLGLVVLAAVIARPQQVVTTLTSPRALFAVVVVVLVTVLLRRLTRRLPAPAASLLAAAPALVAVALLVLPTLRATSVDEDLEGLQPQTSETAAAAASSEDATETQGAAGDDAPVRVSTGEVVGIGHRGSGSASLVQLPGGGLVLRFEDLEVDPGPDYRVYLVPGAAKESPDGGVELAPLKATKGNQNYPLDGVPADGPVTALIWCEAFSVPIAAASLT